MSTSFNRLAITGLAAVAVAGIATPTTQAATVKVKAPAVKLNLKLDKPAVVSPLLEDVKSLTSDTVINADHTAQDVVDNAVDTVNDAIHGTVGATVPQVNAAVADTLAATAQVGLDEALRVQADAQAAGDPVALADAVADVVSAQAVVSLNDATSLVRDAITGAVVTVRATGSGALRLVDGLRFDPVSVQLSTSLRRLGVTAFAVIDAHGRVLRGPGALGVNTFIGGAELTWSRSLAGCAMVALSNDIVPRMLVVDAVTPVRTRIADLDAIVHAGVRTPLRNVTVAALC